MKITGELRNAAPAASSVDPDVVDQESVFFIGPQPFLVLTPLCSHTSHT